MGGKRNAGDAGKGSGDLVHREGVEIRSIPVEAVYADPQIRGGIDEEGLQDLARSIKRVGVLEPIAVQEQPDGRYLVVFGERRYRAAVAAGETVIRAQLLNVDYKELVLIQLTENLLRKDLNPMEGARGIRLAMRLFGWRSKQEVSRETGIPRTTVRERLKLLNLHSDLQAWVEAGKLPSMNAVQAANMADRQQLAALRFLEAFPSPTREQFAQLCQLLIETEGSGADEETKIESVLERALQRAQAGRPIIDPPRPEPNSDEGTPGDESGGKDARRTYEENDRLPPVPRQGTFRVRLETYIRVLLEADDPEYKAAALVLGKVLNSL